MVNGYKGTNRRTGYLSTTGSHNTVVWARAESHVVRRFPAPECVSSNASTSPRRPRREIAEFRSQVKARPAIGYR